MQRGHIDNLHKETQNLMRTAKPHNRQMAVRCDANLLVIRLGEALCDTWPTQVKSESVERGSGAKPTKK